MPRDRRVQMPGLVEQTAFAAGSMPREYAKRMGWNLAPCNLMVEGTTDERYCKLASRLHEAETGLKLIGDDFHVFAAGRGGDGGTDKIKEELRTFKSILQSEPDPSVFKVACLFDCDQAGKKAFSEMRKKFRPWGELFLLQRIMPRTTRDPGQYEKSWNKQNEKWLKLDCEIEDLLDCELLEFFLVEAPSALRRKQGAEGRHHFDLDGQSKGQLARFFESHSALEQVGEIVELLKVFRWLLKLDPEGV